MSSKKLPPPPIEEINVPPEDTPRGVMRDTNKTTRAAVNRDASDLLRNSSTSSPGAINKDSPLSAPIPGSGSVIPAIKVTGKTNLTETEILDNIVYEILSEADTHINNKVASLPEEPLLESDGKMIEEEVFAVLFKKYDELSLANIKRTLPDLSTNWSEGYDCLEVRKRLLGRGLNTKRGKIYTRNVEIMAQRAQRKVEAEKFWRAHAHQLYTFTEGFRPRLPMPRSHLAEMIERNRAAYEKSIEVYPGGPDRAFEFSHELPEGVLNETSYAEKAERFYEQLTSDNNRLVEFNAVKFRSAQKEIILNSIKIGVHAVIEECIQEMATKRLDCYSEEEMADWREYIKSTLYSYRDTVLQKEQLSNL